MKELKVRLTFIEPLLGTSPNNEDVYRDFIGSKAPDAATVEDEVAALGVDAVTEKGMTVFPRMEDGTPCLYDYQIKGFSKIHVAGSEKSRPHNPAKSRHTKRKLTNWYSLNRAAFPFVLMEKWQSASAHYARRLRRASGLAWQLVSKFRQAQQWNLPWYACWMTMKRPSGNGWIMAGCPVLDSGGTAAWDGLRGRN